MYINGKVDWSIKTAGKIRVTDDCLSIGGEEENTGKVWRYFNGKIDEVRISNIARTAEEIRESMKGLAAVEPSLKLAITWGSIKCALE